MAHQFPSKLLRCISTVKSKRFNRFNSEDVWLYAQSPSEYFNDIMEDSITLMRAGYGFNPAEHNDWVCPAICYFAGTEGGDNKNVHPLNSHKLVHPIEPVPSFQEIQEQYEWCRDRQLVSPDKTSSLLSVEELQDQYITKVCMQLQEHALLLGYWREINSPREQHECWRNFTRDHLRIVKNSQRQRVLSAKDKMISFKKAHAPLFLDERASGSYLMEGKIYTQLCEL